MLGSYRLLGMLYYGGSPSTALPLWIMWNSKWWRIHAYIHTDSEAREDQRRGQSALGSLDGRGVFSFSLDLSLHGIFHLHCPDTSNKMAVKSLLPRSLCCFWLKALLFLFVCFYGFDNNWCCFCIDSFGPSFSCNGSPQIYFNLPHILTPQTFFVQQNLDIFVFHLFLWSTWL